MMTIWHHCQSCRKTGPLWRGQNKGCFPFLKLKICLWTLSKLLDSENNGTKIIFPSTCSICFSWQKNEINVSFWFSQISQQTISSQHVFQSYSRPDFSGPPNLNDTGLQAFAWFNGMEYRRCIYIPQAYRTVNACMYKPWSSVEISTVWNLFRLVGGFVGGCTHLWPPREFVVFFCVLSPLRISRRVAPPQRGRQTGPQHHTTPAWVSSVHVAPLPLAGKPESTGVS